MKETIESLERVKELLAKKKETAKKEGYFDIALAYGDALLLVGEEIVNTLNNQSKKLA